MVWDFKRPTTLNRHHVTVSRGLLCVILLTTLYFCCALLDHVFLCLPLYCILNYIHNIYCMMVMCTGMPRQATLPLLMWLLLIIIMHCHMMAVMAVSMGGSGSGTAGQPFHHPGTGTGTLRLRSSLSSSSSSRFSFLSNLRPLQSIQQRSSQALSPPTPSPPAAPDASPDPSPESVDVVVVGAGLCGSTAAFYLDKQGFRVVLAEQAPEVGGCVSTKQSE